MIRVYRTHPDRRKQPFYIMVLDDDKTCVYFGQYTEDPPYQSEEDLMASSPRDAEALIGGVWGMPVATA